MRKQKTTKQRMKLHSQSDPETAEGSRKQNRISEWSSHVKINIMCCIDPHEPQKPQKDKHQLLKRLHIQKTQRPAFMNDSFKVSTFLLSRSNFISSGAAETGSSGDKPQNLTASCPQRPLKVPPWMSACSQHGDASERTQRPDLLITCSFREQLLSIASLFIINTSILNALWLSLGRSSTQTTTTSRLPGRPPKKHWSFFCLSTERLRLWKWPVCKNEINTNDSDSLHEKGRSLFPSELLWGSCWRAKTAHDQKLPHHFPHNTN